MNKPTRDAYSTVYRDRADRSDAMNTYSRWGDRALLLAVMAVGLLPFLGWAFGHPAKNWELGVGVLAVLGAGASFVLDLFPPKRDS